MAQNLAFVRSRIGAGVRLGLVAKADAYGHGLIPVARHALASGADWLCVATVQEGVAVRDAGMSAPVLVLSPLLDIEAEQAVFYDLRLCVENLAAARALSAAAVHQGRLARVHIEVDTGIHRFGVRPSDLPDLVEAARALPALEVEGVCHHYVDSGGDSIRTLAQADLFESVAGGVQPVLRHGSNSAGALRYTSRAHDLVRVGIVAYGIDPYGLTAPGDLRPVLRWQARVTAIRDVDAGATIGYSATHQVTRPSRIATLGVGYGDGYPRTLSNSGVVRIHGHDAAVLGLVCMDQTMIDVTGVPGVALGSPADLIGPGITTERVAELARTNCHEITTRIMSRVPRRYAQP